MAKPAQPYRFDFRKNSSLLGWLLLCCGLGVVGCNSSSRKSDVAAFDLSQAEYVGSQSCVQCHQAEAEAFIGSHHDKAMELATEGTVLGDFDGATLEHHGVTSRFFRDGDRFMVNTEGEDGTLQDFEIKYVFGVDPLQQYMVEFPASTDTDTDLASDEGLPRVQVLRLSWDTGRKEWFYLAPPDVPEKLEPNDDLHWTGIAQRWNTMCAECHSTDYHKNFVVPDSHAEMLGVETTRTTGNYNSTFVEINVSCEACHGPGSKHIELANQWSPGWNRERGYGLANLKASPEAQIQACAPCHSRRSIVAGGFRAGDNFYDHFTNSLLTEGVYYPDGQILDEDYVHGSFIQSKMYHKGIKCTDCHDPHSARLKHDGNQVCTSCHQHPTAKYDSVAHHFHKPDTAGAQCVNCHMPATTYMDVDARRDHSFRIPRPDMSLQTGVPNACTSCHLDPERVAPEKREQLALYQDWMLAAREGDEEVKAELERVNRWADEAMEKWYGENRRRDPHFGFALSAAQVDAPEAAKLLQDVLAKSGYEAPAVARATALQALMRVDADEAAYQATRLIRDEHPLVRASAASALVAAEDLSQSVSLLEAALTDPVRSVRVEAARNLLNTPRNLWNEEAAASLTRALAELTEGLKYNNDRGGSHMTLGILAEQQGRDRQAMGHYEAAVAVEPMVAGPRTNLAALLERNAGAQTQSTGRVNPALQSQIDRLRAEELKLLSRDAELLPDEASIQHRYGLALYLSGDMDAAVERLVRAAELDSAEPAFAQAAALLLDRLGKREQALHWAREGVRRSNSDPQYVALLRQIQSSSQ